MNALQELQSEVGVSRVTGLAGLRWAAAVLAAVGAGLLAQPAPAQTPFTITMEMATGGPVVPATVTVPDAFAIAEQALQCADVRCMQDVMQAVAPALGQLPPVPSPPASPGPSQPEEPASPPPKDGPRASPGPPAAPIARPRKRSPAPESASLPSRPELAEIVASPPGVQERPASRPPPTPEIPPRGSDLLVGSAQAPLLPAALSGVDWSPLLLNVLLAAGSLALLLFVLTATPQHSVGHVSYRLADRRSDLGLLGTVLLFGLAVGYFVATSLG
ncbi:MAG: hypothetical protein ACRDPP_16195 [Gaiellaceae bacterium]